MPPGAEVKWSIGGGDGLEGRPMEWEGCRGRHGCSCPYGRTRRLEPKVIDEFRANGGKVRVRDGQPLLLLTHTGARTGTRRERARSTSPTTTGT